MTYSATMTVLDGEGNVVFERELTPDEMVEEILKGKPQVMPVNTVSDESNGGGGPDRKRKPTTCSQCGGEGHTKKTCKKIAKVEKKQDGSPTFCKKCGKTGHKRKDCPDKEMLERTDGEPLTVRQYMDVKDARTHGMSSLDVATKMGVDIFEVNQIFPAPTYDAYRRNRARA